MKNDPKNNVVNQWIDAEETRTLAESLMKPPGAQESALPEDVYGEDFIGFAGLDVSESEETSKQETSKQEVSTQEASNSKQEISKDRRAVALRSLSEARGKADRAGLVNVSRNEQVLKPPPMVEYISAPVPLSTSAAQELSATHIGARPSAPEPVAPFRLVREEDDTATPGSQSEPSLVAGKVDSDAQVTQDQVERDQSPLNTAPQSSAESNIKGISAIDQPRGQPLAQRMRTFGSWLKQAVPAEAFFVCDRNGEIISDEVGNPKLIKVARTLAYAASSTGRELEDSQYLVSPKVKIGLKEFLQVIPKNSKFGLVVLGVIVPEPLEGEVVAVIAQSLSKTLEDDVSVTV